ncbi:MAG: CAP domain-containing protein [Bacillota bacterium]
MEEIKHEKNDVEPLEINSELTQVARRKSQDMVENDYFSHHSPTYGSPFDMLDHFNIKYLHAGENIATNPSLENAHESLMNSSGHRQNILNSNYTHIGIGITRGDGNNLMITQLFISHPQ